MGGMLVACAVVAQPVMTEMYYNVGTNGYDVFFMSLSNSQPNTVYLWQKSTNVTDWYPSLSPPFVGESNNMSFYDPVLHGSSNTFYRLLVVGPVAKTQPAYTYSNSLPFTNFPSPPMPPGM